MKLLFTVLGCIAIIGSPIIAISVTKEFVIECWEIGEETYHKVAQRISEYEA